jgi:hypothetical protein
MVTELFPLQLAFRGLSDEEGDEVETNSPDTDLDDDLDEDEDDNATPATDNDDVADPVE